MAEDDGRVSKTLNPSEKYNFTFWSSNVKYQTTANLRLDFSDKTVLELMKEKTYKGNEFKNLSRSETIATSLEISNMLNKISGVNLPLFVDDSESCADYNFIEDFSNDTQILIAKVEKGQNLEISNYQNIETMQIAA